MSEKLKLSRRKMLAGLGTIGIASGAAGYGTYAAFNDEESQTTTFTAGELDLRVAYTASYNGEKVANDSDDTDEIELDPTQEDGQLSLKITDLKPGDVGSLNFEIETTENSNDAWVLSQINIANSVDGRDTEPEAQVDDDVDLDEVPNDESMEPGELEYALEFIGFYDSNDLSQFFDDSSGGGYDFDGNTPAVPAAFYDNAQTNDTPAYLPRTLNDLATQDLQQGTNSNVDVTDEDSDYTGAVIVDGDPDNTSDNTQNDALDPLGPGGDAGNPENSINFGYDWHLPANTGNVVQGDSIEIEFKFIAIQDRFSQLPNNADNFLNEADGENSENAETTN
jgi:predicted ribosomally synthesized peptide with SipW-like signal peptide